MEQELHLACLLFQSEFLSPFEYFDQNHHMNAIWVAGAQARCPGYSSGHCLRSSEGFFSIFSL